MTITSEQAAATSTAALAGGLVLVAIGPGSSRTARAGSLIALGSLPLVVIARKRLEHHRAAHNQHIGYAHCLDHINRGLIPHPGPDGEGATAPDATGNPPDVP